MPANERASYGRCEDCWAAWQGKSAASLTVPRALSLVAGGVRRRKGFPSSQTVNGG